MARIRTSPASTGHTILVVDDDADLRVTLSHLLRKDGHEVFEASSGEAAINLCREHPFHLMLLDYFMPGLTGKDVVEQVRALDLQVQIILQTGYAKIHKEFHLVSVVVVCTYCGVGDVYYTSVPEHREGFELEIKAV